MITGTTGPATGLGHCATCGGRGAGRFVCPGVHHNDLARFIGADPLDLDVPAVRALIAWASRVTIVLCPDCDGLGVSGAP